MIPEPPFRGPLDPGERQDSPQTWVWDIDLPLIAPFNWGEFSTLVAARDEILVGLAGSALVRRLTGVHPDAANRLRQAWMEHLGPGPDDLVIRPATDGPRRRLLLLGDTGEGDLSQWAVRRPMLARAGAEGEPALDMAVVMSDVIYSAGQAINYRDRFHGPLRELDVPVYAIPGNHDWDDGTLASFMHTFVARDVPGHAWPPDPDPHDGARLPDWIVPPAVRDAIPGWSGRLRGPWLVDALDGASAFERLATMRLSRAARVAAGPSEYPAFQPASYFAVDVAGVVLVCIDQGFSMQAPMDAAQSAWLARMLGGDEHRDRPVVLVVGKPFAVKGAHKEHQALTQTPGAPPLPATLQDLVAAHRNVVAVIGGDVHNYQHYRQADGPDLIVAGGSGAYMAGSVGTAANLARPDAGLLPDPVLYPSEAQSEVYLRDSLTRRLGQVPVGVALAALGAAVTTAMCAVLAVLFAPSAPRDLLLGVGLGAVAAALWALWARARGPGLRGALGTFAFLATLVAVALLHLGVLAGLADDGLARYAGLLSFGVAAALIGATFLPFGVLSAVFPLPSLRPAPAMIGALAVTWLLTLAHPALVGAGMVSDAWLLSAAVLVVPILLVAAGYVAPVAWTFGADGRGFEWTWARLGMLVVLALALDLMGLHLAADAGARITLAIAGAGAVVVAVATLILRVRAASRPGASTLSVGYVLLAGVVVVAAWGWFLDTRIPHGPHLDQLMGRSLPLAVLVALTSGSVAFLLVRAIGPLLGRSARFVDWLAQAGGFADVWSVLETTEPPFYKSFLELVIDRDRRHIEVIAWGVSGFEADADRPIEIDRFTLPWTR